MKKIIYSESAPRPIGPYSQAVQNGDQLFGAGQLGLDPISGEMVLGGAAGQAEQALANISAVLAAADMTMQHVVKTTIYLTSLDDFPAVNAVYARFFPINPPARTTVEVKALTLGGRVEIDFIAVLS